MLELRGEPVVVAVQKGYVPALRSSDSGVARRGCSAIGLPNQAHAFAEALDDRCGVIGRTVVDDDAFEIPISLAEHAAHRAADETLAVVSGNHRAHERQVGPFTTPRRML